MDWMKGGWWNWSSQFLCQPVGSGFWKQDSQNTSAHALSIVTWYNQNIVNSYHLIMFTHLFKAESAINDFILRSESSQNYLFFLIPKGINKLISKGIKEQAGAQMGQAQLKLGLGFTPTNLHH